VKNTKYNKISLIQSKKNYVSINIIAISYVVERPLVILFLQFTGLWMKILLKSWNGNMMKIRNYCYLKVLLNKKI